MAGKLNLTLVRMQVGLEGQDFRVAAAGLPEKVQAGELFNVPHPSRVHLYELLHPFRLILRALQQKASHESPILRRGQV